ncbi:hypothetical protein FRC08_000682 [Ceratobasidium sp. 394]|nr:hypothetical protein FRC08_000682 [Ceratobasidium sp. 394]
MDGLTVKRCSTISLGVLGHGRDNSQPPAGVADYIIAMTVGVPQLETFNYATKELKEYISNGEKAIQILGDDLDANNLYLFKEYLASGEEDQHAIELIFEMNLRNCSAYTSGVLSNQKINYIELVYNDQYHVQLKCVAHKPIPFGCHIHTIPLEGQQEDQKPQVS